MTPDEIAAQLAPADREAVLQEAARRSFVRFLPYVSIESDGTPSDEDNPDTAPERGAIPFKPYPYQAERARAWQAGGNEIILKERQLGISWLDAAYTYWTAGYHASSHVALFSRTKPEAKKLMRKVRYIHNHLPDGLRAPGSIGIEMGEFANDSTVTPFPSVEDAGIGETNRLVIFDEFAYHEYGESNLAAVLPTVAGSGQLIINSTASHTLGPAGAFYERWVGAGGMDLTDTGVGPIGANGFRPVFLGRGIRPGRNADWYARQRPRYAEEAQFAAFYPVTPHDAFQGREGLVYPMADVDRHCRPAPVPWEACTARYYGTDLGGGDPGAVVVAGLYRSLAGPRLHVYGCHYAPKTTGAMDVSEIGTYLTGYHKRAPFRKAANDPAPGGGTVAASLAGLFGLPGQLARNKRNEGLELVAQWLHEGWITFEPDVWPGFAVEFASYRWTQKSDPHSREKYDTDTPYDHHGDRLDALRYLLMAVYYDELNQGGRAPYARVEVRR